jgi:hypothetical protein
VRLGRLRTDREEGYAAAEEIIVGHDYAGGDFGVDKNGRGIRRLAGIRDGDANFGIEQVMVLGFETHATAGHIDTVDDVIFEGLAANAGAIVDLHAAVQAAIGLSYGDGHRWIQGKESGLGILSGRPWQDGHGALGRNASPLEMRSVG